MARPRMPIGLFAGTFHPNKICNSLKMPKIVHYLSRLSNARYYDDHELAKLQTVYDRGRFTLNMGSTIHGARDSLC